MGGIEFSHTNELAMVNNRIVIEMGLDADGKRAIRYEFKELTPDGDDDEVVSYFDGKLMLAVASDGLLETYGMIHAPDDDEDC